MLNSDLNSNKYIKVNLKGNKLITVFFVIIFSLFLSFHSAHYIQAEELKLEPIKTITVDGLKSLSKERFLYLLGISTGKIINRDEIREGIKRAFLTEIFEDISVETIDKNSFEINIKVKEKKIIDSIIVEGNNHFSKKFIKNNFPINKGSRFSDFKLDKATFFLKNVLSDKGFPNANIYTDIIPIEDIKIKIKIIINEQLPDLINKINISDNSNQNIVKKYLNLSVGDIFDKTKMETFKNKLVELYKNQDYIQTSVDYTFKENTLNIKLDIGNKVKVSFIGNRYIPSKDLLEEVNFIEANNFTDDMLEETILRIKSFYYQNGFLLAQVMAMVPFLSKDIEIRFFIFEGNKYKVSDILFNGASISEKKLQEILPLKITDNYDPTLLPNCKDILIEFYQSIGYPNIEVKYPDINIDKQNVLLSFEINEGKQIKISNVEIKNNKYFKEPELITLVGLKKGDLYIESNVIVGKRRLQQLYQKEGFYDIDVSIQTATIDNSFIDIILNITEGNRYVFGKNIIVGNENIKDIVIERELLHKEGDKFNDVILSMEKQNLLKLGLFSEVEITVSESFKSVKDIIYKFKENNAGVFEFGFGYDEYERIRVFFDVKYKNFRGLQEQIGFKTDLSLLEQRYAVIYRKPWFLNTKNILYDALLMYENKRAKNIDTGTISYKLKRYTANTGIEKTFSENLMGEIDYDFSFVDTIDVQPDAILSRDDVGTLIISGIKAGLVYDTRDSIFETKNGWFAGITYKIATQALLSETNFNKAIMFINKYQHINNIIFASSVRIGMANPFGNTKALPITERFFLGGRTTVRGYKQDMLGPKGINNNPIGGNVSFSGNAEIRFPIWKNFGLAPFVDFGNVWDTVKNFHIKDIKFTVGMGVRYITFIGPIRIDYGYKLKREPAEDKGMLYFSIGNTF